MNINNNNNSSSGVTLLQIVFIVLKLCGIINWSWWWVLSPMWISIAIVLLIVGVWWLILKFTK